MNNKDKLGQSKLLASLAFVALLSVIVIAQGSIIQLEKTEYKSGELVNIKLNLIDFANKTLKIRAGSKLFTYSGALRKDIEFRAETVGKYDVTLEDRLTLSILDEASFNVLDPEPAPESSDVKIIIEKEEYLIGESINVNIQGSNLENYKLYLINGDNELLYVGDLNEGVNFPATGTGEYRIILEDKEQNTAAEASFTIKEPEEAKELIVEENKTQLPSIENNTENASAENAIVVETSFDTTPAPQVINRPRINTKREHLGAKMKMHDKVMSLKKISDYYERTDLEISFPGIAEAKFEQVNLQGKIDLDIEKLSEKKINIDQVHNALDVIAIDPSRLDFQSASLTRKAKGTELWKCKDWNFTTQTCFGTWQKILDLIPGQEYNITINASDPAFTEAGVATVNTKKPIYRSGETAELIMVVLDTEGFVVKNADLTLIITSPGNTTSTFTTTGGQILETDDGVYELNFTDTALEGVYLLNVSAQVTNITQEMQSYFFVQNIYDFDIIRTMPVKIDPRDGFRVSFDISPFIALSTYNFTEVVPLNFTILNSGGAIISNDSDFTYLTWTSLSGNSSLNYTAKAPKIIPNIEILGTSFIEHSLGTFEEARPWYLAIDPEISFSSFEAGDIDMCPLTNTTFAIGWCQNEADPNDLCRLAVYNVNGSLIDDIDVDTSADIYSRIAVSCINNTHLLLGHIDSTPEILTVGKYSVAGGALSLVDGLDTFDGDMADAGEDFFDVAATIVSDTYGWVAATDNQDEDSDHNRVTISDLTLGGDYQADDTTASDTPWDNHQDVCAISTTRIVGCWFDDSTGGANDALSAIVYDETGTIQVAAHNIDTDIGGGGGISCDCLRGDRVAYGYYESDLDDIVIQVRDYTGDSTATILGQTSIDGNAGTSERVATAEIEADGSSYFGVIFSDTNAGNIKAGIYDEDGAEVTAPFIITSDENTNELYRIVDIVGAQSHRNLSLCNGTFVAAYTRSDGQAYWQGFRTNGSTWDGICPSSPTAPTNIQCDNDDNCNITVTSSVVLNASGSTDSDGDNIMYSLEALLQNTTIIQNGSNTSKIGEAGQNVYINEDFEVDEGSFSYQDDIYQGTSTPAQSSGVRETNANCATGDCLAVDLNVAGPIIGGPFSGGWNRTFNIAGNPTSVNVTFDYTLRLDEQLETTENTSLYYRNISNNAETIGATIVGNGNGGGDDFTSGTITNILTVADGNYYFDAGCWLSTVSATDENAECWIDNVIVTGLGTSSNETNTTYTTYNDINGEYGRISSITITVEVDSYNPEASVNQSTSDPDLQLEIYNGSNWISIGNFDLSSTYTETGLNTSNYNFSLTTTDSTILTAWETSSNQDFRIRGVLMDYLNTTVIDEINYTNVWITINGKNWNYIGNHTETTSFTWITSNITDQTGVDLRSRAIDLNGTNAYSAYFTKGANMTLSAIPPPVINSVECYETGVGWEACSNIQFGDVLDAVRANCTPGNASNAIQNISFMLQNIEDNNTFFNNLTTDNSTSFWVANITNVPITDSGTFRLTTTCRENPTSQDTTDWQVAWGNISITLIDPSANINATQNRFFNFTSRVACTGGECGWVNVTLDPISTQVYNITGADTFTVPAGVTIIKVKIWGAGGGGGGAHSTNAGGDGGAGGYVEANLTVTPGETLDLFVGGGGGGGIGTLGAFVTGEGGGGGGRTLINRTTPPLLLAGAGGGGGGGDNSGAGVGDGGVGGASVAGDGGDASAGTTGGNGGDQSSGGTAGSGDNSGTAGSSLTGGEGGDSGAGGQGTGDADNGGTGGGGDGGTVEADFFAGGGGGGSGYFGGGGAGSSTSGEAGGGGGGGGSNYLTGTFITNSSGSGTTPPNTGDSDYQSGVGVGGAAGTSGGDGSSGGTGLIVISYLQPKGIIPMNSGTPFYTTTQNPANSTTFSCLANMTAGDTCDTTWAVNATGAINTTWEFFVLASSLNYSTYVNNSESAHINITIIENLAPAVGTVSLTPSVPATSSDLNCTFTITDANAEDTLTANVSWYNNGVLSYSANVGVTNGVQQSAILSSSNTSIGEVWHCGIIPFDQFLYGSQVNSSNVTILASIPPVINQIQCQENGGAWSACSNVIYNDNLTAVRANCTDPDGLIINVTFNFTNVDDANVLFNGTTTDNSTGYFVFNNTDLTIIDSGSFNMTVACIDNTSIITNDYVNWSLPWGVINISLVNPSTDINVTQNRFFNMSVQIECLGGECGNVSANSRRANETVIGYLSTGNLLTNPGAETGDLTGWTEADQGFFVDDQTDFTTITPRTGNWMFIGGPGSGSHVHTLYQEVDVSTYAIDIDAGLVNASSSVWLAAQTIDPIQIFITFRNATGGVLATYSSGLHASETWTEFTDYRVVPNGTRSIILNATSTSAGDYDDAAMDDTNITLFYPQKSTDMVVISTVTGDTPLYTSAAQPQFCYLYGNQTCQLIWPINATGSVGSSIAIDSNASSPISQVPYNESKNITITIVQNSAPLVSSVLIAPPLPVFIDNLTCSFTVTDPNTFDVLTANVSWYNSSNLVYSEILDVTSGVEASSILNSSYTSANEVWHCGIIPYDQYLYGSQVNSSNVTILANLPPQIAQIECQENGSVWEACSSLVFGDVFSGVRLNCTGPTNPIQNATFNFTNDPDGNIFYNLTTNNSGVWWYYFENITMNNSGDFTINATCSDNASITATTFTTWSIPWGTIVGNLVEPSSNTNVQQNEFFTFTANVQCLGGECGDVNATLDPGFPAVSPSNGTPDAGGVDAQDPDDESGGTYVDTQTNDASYFAIGEDDDENAFSYLNLTFNISVLDINPLDIENLSLTLTYCHSGENSYAEIDCNGDDPYEKTISADQDVWFWNYVELSYTDVGNLDITNGENEVTDTFTPTSNLDSYISSDGLVTIRTEIFTGPQTGDAWLAIDHAILTVTYTKIKRGAISTVIGATPFYTTHPNPKDYTNTSCLASMIAGDTCQVSWPVNATGVINSTHEFWVIYNLTNNRAYVEDNETAHINITIVDLTQVPPIVTLIAPSNNLITNNPAIIFNCSATDNAGLQNMTLYADFNGTFLSNGTNALGGTDNSTLFNRTLADGVYEWNCFAYDTHGNSDWGASNWTLTVDTVAPVISLSAPSNGESLFTGTITYNYTVIDAIDATLTCNITVNSVVVDNGYSATNGSLTSRTIGGFAQGNYFWNVTCIDDAGNVNTSNTWNFSIVEIPPSVILVTQNNLSQSSTTINLEFNASDNNDVTEARLYLNGILNDTTTSVNNGDITTFVVNNLPEGRHNWTVNVTDVSNLTDQAPERWFTIDFTAPVINLSAPPDNHSTNLSTILFNFTVTDNLDNDKILVCNITINSTVFDLNFNANNGSLTSRTINNVPDGISYWNVTCIDDAGNYNTSETRMINVSSPPTVVLNNPADNYSQSSSTINLYYTPTDNTNLSSCNLILGGSVNQTNTTINNGVENNFTVTGLAEGNYNWTVICTDLSGLNSTTPSVRRFIIDSQAPLITLFNPLPNETITGPVTFNFTSSDNVDLSIDCNLTIDGSVNETIAVPNGTNVNRSLLPSIDGIHYWNVTCIDDAGNFNTSETRNFTTQNPPAINLISPAQATILNYSLNVNFTYYIFDSDGVNLTKLLINGQEVRNNTSPTNDANNFFLYNFTVDGVYNWSVNATDAAGLESTSEIRQITIDTTPPNLTYITPTEGETVTSNNVTLTFTVTDNLDSSLLCNITVNDFLVFANVTAANATNITRYYVLADGNHNWSAVCVDHADNKNTVVTINFSVSAPPNVTLNFPTPEYRTKNRNITFNYTPLDAVGFLNCSLIVNGLLNQTNSSIQENVPNFFDATDFTDGDHNWTVQCIDEDLNSFTPNPENLTIDNIGPNITLNFPTPAQVINSNNVTFNWTPTDHRLNAYINCTIFVSDPLGQRINATNETSGLDHVVLVPNLQDGDHLWNVTCSDDLGNIAISSLRNFTINQPDLATSNGNLSFNNSNPDPVDNITILLNVTNLGGNPANGVIVEFWNGNRETGTQIGNTTISVSVNATVVANVSWVIPRGFHTVNAYVDPDNLFGELSELNNNATQNISTLIVNITDPANNTFTNDTTPGLSFNMSDFSGSNNLNYTIYVDGSVNGQNGSSLDNTITTINVSALVEGVHTIIVQTTDPLGRSKNSTELTITIDLTPPTPVILTANNTFFNTSTPNITIRVTDNLDPTLNYTLYVNGAPHRNGTVTSGVEINLSIGPLSNGSYTLILQGTDEVGQSANSTPIVIFIDQIPPVVTLNAPANNTDFTTTTVQLNYTVTDNLDTTLACNITLDGSIVDSDIVTNNTLQSYTTTGLSEGNHFWNVTCKDSAFNENVSETRQFNVFVPPVLNLLLPTNNSVTNNASVLFTYNVTDDTGIENCSLLLDGVINQTNTTVTNGAENGFAVSFSASRVLTWAVQCFDNTSLNVQTTSENRTLTVDQNNPVPVIETINQTWFTSATPSIDFNITDNFDPNISYLFYADGVNNTQGFVANATSSSANLSSLSDGTHIIILQGTDDAGNAANSTSITIYIDTSPPNVTLLYPPNGTNFSVTTVQLNFTVIDNLDDILVCNLTLDGSIIRSNINVTNNTIVNTTQTGLSTGPHYWNATCVDNATNTATSDTFVFNIEAPDLVPLNLTFNETQPEEGTNITITVNITNQGNLIASNITVQFIEGAANTTAGTQINGNITISSLGIGAYTIISVNYTTLIGLNQIFVVVDPPIASGGDITEENENNNVLNRSFIVGNYQIVAGDTIDVLRVDDGSLISLFTWNVSNSTGSNVFVADTDSSVDFTQLQAISRTTSDVFEFNDFAETDVQLGTTGVNDSINATWTSGGAAIATKTIQVFSTDIANIPIVNSTNTSDFQTGLLWDYSDGGSNYNGTQDLLLITQMNEDKTGQYGTYDYEIRIPATLRDYRAGTSSVSFYTEVK